MSVKIPPLIADRMCGRLAKYLRIIGFEVFYPPVMSDMGLINMTIRKSAILLTRDRWIKEKMSMASREDQVILLESDDIFLQVSQVLDRLGVTGQIFIDKSKCIYCGGELLLLDMPEARHLVPTFVFRTQVEIFHCPTCNYPFWKGTQWESFEKRLVGMHE